MQAPCVLFTGINEVAVSTTDVPEPSVDEVMIETLFSCVSPGTELRCLAGLQDHLGRDHFPFIPGYALVGHVVQPDAAGRFAEGQLVFCSGTRRAAHRLSWGGHVRRAVAPVAAVIPLPAGIDPVEASLLKLAAIAHRGVLLADPQPGETVVVAGLGPIGQLSARLFARTGARVIATDVAPERVAIAAAPGIETVVAGEAVDEAIRLLLPHGADIVVDATGYPRALRQTVSAVRDRPWVDQLPPSGKLVVQGSYSGDVPFPQDVAFTKELRVFWPRDCLRSDLESIVAYLHDGSLQMRALVGAPCPVAQAPEAYDALRRKIGGNLTVAFDWDA